MLLNLSTMGLCAYDSEQALLDACPTIKDKVERVEQIITALENVLIDSTLNMETGSYMLDDGQTKINRVFRSPSEIEKAIFGFIRLRNLYVRRITGGRIKLIPEDRVNYGKYGGY